MAFAQAAGVVHDLCAAGLDAAVIAVGGREHIGGGRVRIVHQQTNVGEQGRAIGLERQALVATLVEDRPGRDLLAVHRIGGHDPALERQQRQQLGQRRALVAVAVDLALAEHEALLDRPGADQMERSASATAVERASRGLAVDRHHRSTVALDPAGESSDEPAEAGLEHFRIEQPEPTREGVVAGHPTRQPQERRSSGSLACPNSAMSTQLSAPHRVAASAISRISTSS
jgi:hypothetical protein